MGIKTHREQEDSSDEGERVCKDVDGLRKKQNKKPQTHLGIKKKKKKCGYCLEKNKLFSLLGSDLLIITLLFVNENAQLLF